MANCYCEKCQKTMKDTNFYTYKDGTKSEMCKSCLTMHIDNFNPDTYLWLLEKFDVPYMPEEWISLRDKAFAKDPYKMNGMSVFGKYLSKMKLVQYNKYGWADTETLMAKKEQASRKTEAERQEEEERLKAALANGDINERRRISNSCTVGD